MTEHTQHAQQQYALPLAILVGAILVSATVFLVGGELGSSLKGISEKISVLGAAVANLQITAGGGAGQNGTGQQPAPSGIEIKQAPSVNLQGLTPKGNGKITIIEYSDFECPFCGRAQTTVNQLLSSGNVKLYFKQFPLPPQMHPNAQKAAEASLCVQEQEKFWEYHDILFANQQALSVQNLTSYAKQLGLDEAKFTACLSGGEKASAVSAHQQEGALLGVGGTPSFYLIDSDATADVEGLKTLAGTMNVGGREYMTLYRDASGKIGVLVVGAQPISVFEGVLQALS